jgi:hypothetical protein
MPRWAGLVMPFAIKSRGDGREVVEDALSVRP